MQITLLLFYSPHQDQRDFNQLSGELANQTAERNYLQMMNQNLTYERDQLEVSLKVAELNLEQMKKESGEFHRITFMGNLSHTVWSFYQ